MKRNFETNTKFLNLCALDKVKSILKNAEGPVSSNEVIQSTGSMSDNEDVSLLGAEEIESGISHHNVANISQADNNNENIEDEMNYESQNFQQQKMQGIVFVEDAIHYRSIHHRSTNFSLKLYRWYYSDVVQYSVNVSTFIILMLAFFEDPSSLSWSSDPRRGYERVTLPLGFTEGIELVCLVVLTVSNIILGVLTTKKKHNLPFFRQYPWMAGGYIVLFISFVDLIVSILLGNVIYRIRIRRLFRPYFFAQHTTMLKKTVKAMWNTLPEIASVLTLLSLHLYFFTMLGMLVFPHSHVKFNNGTSPHGAEFNSTEWKVYFNTLDTALLSLVVLLTTANNPDVMMPAYSENRLYAIYFILFSLIGTFLVFNLLTAIIYNQFRGYFKSSMQTSYFRRCVALSAAFFSLSSPNNVAHHSIDSGEDSEQLKISTDLVSEVLEKASMSPNQRRVLILSLRRYIGSNHLHLDRSQFCSLFKNVDHTLIRVNRRAVPVYANQHLVYLQRMIMSRYFNIAGNLIVLCNAILMTIEIAIHYEDSFQRAFSRLNIMNYVFVGYYFIEQLLKIFAFGKRYFVDINFLYDGVISIVLVILEIVQLSVYGHGSAITTTNYISLWDCARIVNILVLMRLLRVIPNFKPMAMVTSVLMEIIRSLRSFAGIIIIIYYVFAIFGMMIFENTLLPPVANGTTNSSFPVLVPPSGYECGTYQQLEYWANNFNDFAASLVVLWDVMVVNNWQIFLIAYTNEVSPWSQVYFVFWWLISAVVCVNLFIALILDHFIAKWEGSLEETNATRRGTIQSLFQQHLLQPSQMRINEELNKHPCFYSQDAT